MKKILLIIISVIVLGTCIFFFFKKEENYILLEVNPSIKIIYDNDYKVIDVKALNDDAKALTLDYIKSDDLIETIRNLTDKLIDTNYIMDRSTVLVNVSGKLDNETVVNNINEVFENRKINVNVEVVKITSSASKKANEYNISELKASYIESVIDDTEYLFEEFVFTPISDINNIIISEDYCDKGYKLEGDFCIKVVNSYAASTGLVCPVLYEEIDGECYKRGEGISTGKIICDEGFTMEGDKCIGYIEVDATANFTCDTGSLILRDVVPDRTVRESGDRNDYLCRDDSNASYPVERCYLQEHAIINGKCAMGPKPLLPTPTGCEGHDINYNGGCYDPYPSEPYVCPNGERYDTNDQKCEDTVTYTPASGSYTCSEGSLNGSKCILTEERGTHYETYCLEGYTLEENGACINYNDTASKINGFICENGDRIQGETCFEEVFASPNKKSY